ncbi:MAG: MTH938/NDUFAF3 family protein [Hyphomicrobiales bacterium]
MTSFFPGRAAVDAYGGGGFRFAGMSHRGSLLLLPSGIYAWPVSDASGLTPASLEPARREADAIDLLILGTGAAMVRPAPELVKVFAGAGVQLDCMATPVAISTYNLLLAEKRRVAAGLIAVPA